VSGCEERAARLDEEVQKPDFWSQGERAREILKERAALVERAGRWRKLQESLAEAKILAELAEETGEAGADAEALGAAASVEREISRLELEQLLSGEHDAGNAIVSFHAGAGGTEAQDWAQMLLRMYLRWCERKGFKADVVDVTEGEGAGIKSATMTVEGRYAYGYLSAEAGIHRLVRISPFDANARRHTSFASVFVYPEVEEDVEVKIRDEDLRIDTFRSSGAGGQHVNKTDSAVRITHLPTNIVVTCQNERSQHKNRATAMKILRSRLYELELRKQREKIEALHQTKKDIAFGSQIRSYVLHPYRMVKDHRTGVEVGDADAVLDGELDRFIEAYLGKKMAEAGRSQEQRPSA